MRTTKHRPTEQPPEAGTSGVPFGIEIVAGGRATTVAVAGELDAANVASLGDALVAAARDTAEVRLDLERTTFIDSAGIRVLVRSMWSLREQGTPLRLVTASPMAENILRITGILDILKDPTP